VCKSCEEGGKSKNSMRSRSGSKDRLTEVFGKMVNTTPNGFMESRNVADRNKYSQNDDNKV
jgi:hypothetical protein